LDSTAANRALQTYSHPQRKKRKILRNGKILFGAGSGRRQLFPPPSLFGRKELPNLVMRLFPTSQSRLLGLGHGPAESLG